MKPCSPSDLLERAPLPGAMLAHRCPFCPRSRSQPSPHFHTIAQLSSRRPHTEMGECLEFIIKPAQRKDTYRSRKSSGHREKLYKFYRSRRVQLLRAKATVPHPQPTLPPQRSQENTGKHHECSRNSCTTGWKARPLKITPVP